MARTVEERIDELETTIKTIVDGTPRKGRTNERKPAPTKPRPVDDDDTDGEGLFDAIERFFDDDE